MLQKSSCLHVAGVVDLPLTLLGEVFQRYLAVRYIPQLVTQSKTVKIILLDFRCFQHYLTVSHFLTFYSD